MSKVGITIKQKIQKEQKKCRRQVQEKAEQSESG